MPTAFQSQIQLLDSLYLWDDFPDVREPTFTTRLDGPISITKSIPDILSSTIQGKLEAVAKVKSVRGDVGPTYGNVDHQTDNNVYATLPLLLLTNANVHGSKAIAAIKDLDTSTEVIRVDGIVRKTRKNTITISAFDYSRLQTKFPLNTIFDLYPNVDATQANVDDAAIIIPFGLCTRVTLYNLDTTDTTNYDYGPIYGAITLTNVYRNGRLVPSAQYTKVIDSHGYTIIRFAEPQLDGQGSQFLIQVDMTGTTLGEDFATVIKYILDQIGFTTNATSFSNATSTLSSLSYKCGGVVTKRTTAEKLIQQLAVRGMFLDVNFSDEITITVDTDAEHSLATTKLIQSPSRSNVVNIPSYDEVDLDEQIRAYILKGYFDPGFSGQSAVYERTAIRGKSFSGSSFIGLDVVGIEKEDKNEFIFDSTTLDKECDYRFKILRRRSRNFKLECTPTTADIQIQDLVDLTLYEHYIENETWVVTEISYEGSSVEFTVVPYDSSDYTYVAGDVSGIPPLTPPIDYYRTLPSPPLNFAVVGYSVALLDDESTGVVVTLTADAPTTNPLNISHMDFVSRVQGSEAIFGYQRVAVTSQQTGIQASVRIDPNSSYHYSAYSVNDQNAPDSQESTRVDLTSQTAPDIPAVSDPSPLTFSSSATFVGADGGSVSNLILNVPAMPTNASFLEIQLKLSGGIFATKALVIAGGGTIRIDQLTPGFNYEAAVLAWNQGGGKSNLVPSTDDPYLMPSDVVAPSDPTSLVATDLPNAVGLDWNDNTESDFSEYAVYRHTSDVFGSSSKIAEVHASAFIDGTGVVGTPYFYWITAIDRSENESSQNTGTTTGTPLATSVDVTPSTPSPPIDSATADGTYLAGDGTVFAFVNVTFPAMPTNGDYMNLLVRLGGTTSDDFRITAQDSIGSTTARVDDLTPGVSYRFAVRAYPAAGSPSVISSTILIVAPNDGAAPSPPTNLVAINLPNAVSLDWDDNTEADFSEYGIYRHTSDVFGSATKIAEARTSAFIDGTGSVGQLYYYWVTAFDRTENESAQNTGTHSGTPQNTAIKVTPSTPSPPIDSATADGTYQADDGRTLAFVNVTFPAMPTNGDYMNMYTRISGGSSPDYHIVAQDTVGSAEVQVDDLTPGVSYVFAVRAFPAAGSPSSFSTNISIVAPGDTTLPATVTGMSSVAGTGKQINVRWNDLTAADKTIREYIIYRNTTTNPTIEYARSNTNNFVDTNLSYNTTYYYRVKAIDHSGNVSASYSANTSKNIQELVTTDYGDDSVTNVKIDSIAASKIVTGTLTVDNGVTGASTITIKGAGDIKFQGDDTQWILFQTSGASTRVRMGWSNPTFNIDPATDNAYDLRMGDQTGAAEWRDIELSCDQLLHIQAANADLRLSANEFQVTGAFVEASGVGGLSISDRLDVHNAAGSRIGYIPIYS